MLADTILKEKSENTSIIDKIDRYLLEQFKPKDTEREQISSINDFEEFCHSLQKHTPGIIVKKMTVHEFYSLIRLVKKQSSKNGGKSD
ncbi:MAG: hypothetical protein WDZ41_01900 [Candidatus Babeliales bacterium]